MKPVMFKALCRLALLSVSMLGSTGSAQSVDNAQPASTPIASWVVTYDNRANAKKLACVMTQSIVQTESQQRIISARIRSDNDDNIIMLLSLPHGLHLPSGVVVSVDEGDESEHPIHSADTNGAYSSVALSPEIIEDMKVGNTLSVKITGVGGNEIIIGLSLIGFFDAFALISK